MGPRVCFSPLRAVLRPTSPTSRPSLRFVSERRILHLLPQNLQMRTEMRGIVCLVLFLLQRVAAFCPEAFTCSATNGVEFDCSSKTAANGFVHCCCSNRGRQCYHLSECYTTTHTSCFWQYHETDNKQTFGGQYRYRTQMDGSYNYVDVQLQSSDHRVSAYLASGDNCNRWFGDAGFQYEQYLMSNADTYRWHHDLGAFPASTYCILLDCNNRAEECTTTLSFAFRECSSTPPRRQLHCQPRAQLHRQPRVHPPLLVARHLPPLAPRSKGPSVSNSVRARLSM